MTYWRARTMQDLQGLDSDEMSMGYRDGLKGDPEPGDNRSDAYRHGWMNGATDGGQRPVDEHQRELARDVARAASGERKQ